MEKVTVVKDGDGRAQRQLSVYMAPPEVVTGERGSLMEAHLGQLITGLGRWNDPSWASQDIKFGSIQWI